jgi:hypothetical protein
MKALVSFASLAAIVVAVLLLHGAGHASNPFAVSLANAASKCPNIVDANAHGLPAGAAPTATLDDKCAIDFGIPAGAKGDPGAAGATGPAGAAGRNGVSGYVRVAAHSGLSKSDAGKAVDVFLSATAKCPPGKKVIGGGAAMTKQEFVDRVAAQSERLMASQPTPNGQGWTATAVARRGRRPKSASILVVTAICAAVS